VTRNPPRTSLATIVVSHVRPSQGTPLDPSPSASESPRWKKTPRLGTRGFLARKRPAVQLELVRAGPVAVSLAARRRVSPERDDTDFPEAQPSGRPDVGEVERGDRRREQCDRRLQVVPAAEIEERSAANVVKHSGVEFQVRFPFSRAPACAGAGPRAPGASPSRRFPRRALLGGQENERDFAVPRCPCSGGMRVGSKEGARQPVRPSFDAGAV
jgi:hypothetical protein